MAKRGAGVPRWVEVTPERIEGWIVSFAERHGETTAEPGPDVVVFRAADGAVAECHAPFPPLRGLPPAPLRGAQETGGAGSDPEARQVPPGQVRVRQVPVGQVPVRQPSPGQVPVGQVPPDRDPVGLARLMATHAAADRTVAVLLVRLGGYAVGVFSGSPPRLEASKVGTRLVDRKSTRLNSRHLVISYA